MWLVGLGGCWCFSVGELWLFGVDADARFVAAVVWILELVGFCVWRVLWVMVVGFDLLA